MNLQDFVAEALTQIVAGVAQAQENALKYGAKISPRHLHQTKTSEEVFFDVGTQTFAQMVQFDVAVTVSESKKKGAGGGLEVAVARLKGSGEAERSDSTVSRVQFSVPVVLPPLKP